MRGAAKEVRGVADLVEERRRRSTGVAEAGGGEGCGGSGRGEAEEVRGAADLCQRGRVERIWRGAEEPRRRPVGRGGEGGMERDRVTHALPRPAPRPLPFYMAGRLGLAA